MTDDNRYNTGEIEDTDPPDETELADNIEGIRLTPQEHQQIKDLMDTEEFAAFERQTRRYLVVGAGGDTAAADRREIVYETLQQRTSPTSAATQLENYGLTNDDLRLWTRFFDILCGKATHIVGVIEDFEGGYVWELGLLFAPSYRDRVWILKRRYEDDDTEREKYDNGMAISHVKLVITGPRAHEWLDTEELRSAVEQIP